MILLNEYWKSLKWMVFIFGNQFSRLQKWLLSLNDRRPIGKGKRHPQCLFPTPPPPSLSPRQPPWTIRLWNWESNEMLVATGSRQAQAGVGASLSCSEGLRADRALKDIAESLYLQNIVIVMRGSVSQTVWFQLNWNKKLRTYNIAYSILWDGSFFKGLGFTLNLQLFLQSIESRVFMSGPLLHSIWISFHFTFVWALEERATCVPVQKPVSASWN
jgi:hypothetical protein